MQCPRRVELLPLPRVRLLHAAGAAGTRRPIDAQGSPQIEPALELRRRPLPRTTTAATGAWWPVVLLHHFILLVKPDVLLWSARPGRAQRSVDMEGCPSLETALQLGAALLLRSASAGGVQLPLGPGGNEPPAGPLQRGAAARRGRPHTAAGLAGRPKLPVSALDGRVRRRCILLPTCWCRGRHGVGAFCIVDGLLIWML
mmetsp:Transcript_49001/g.146416  ORF Transcript_49001/g.146416 Transcript_49001/m.146416 type:complete len:200 (+) Transcript_49001:793-1392(+)